MFPNIKNLATNDFSKSQTFYDVDYSSSLPGDEGLALETLCNDHPLRTRNFAEKFVQQWDYT